MTGGGSAKVAAGAFAHSAFVHHDDTEYAAVLAAFVRDGLTVCGRVLVVAEPARLEVLRAASVVHGGGSGRLSWWVDDGALVCEVVDAGRVIGPLVGRRWPAPASIGGYGLWLANSICDLVQIRSSATGTTARIHMRPIA